MKLYPQAKRFIEPRKRPPTARQLEVLEVIRHTLAASNRAPSVDEIRAFFGLNSKNAIRKHLDALGSAGLIKKAPGCHRNIILVDKNNADWDVASQEELLDKLTILRRCFSDCANDVEDDESTTSKEVRTRDRFIDTFAASIHPDWSLSVIFSGKFGRTERSIILTLLCKAKCTESSQFGREDLYCGEGDQQTADEDAVLFFDECDAMFYDRDSASRNWEVRDVNVLLQELEKFQGVCILSTNRKVTLDKALARRISLKLDFKPPTREQATMIWKRMLPKKLPLADDVDVEELSRTSLTGGEIKNVILNATRRAADSQESIKTRKVTMADFRWALAHEVKGKDFSEGHREMIGFRHPMAVG